MTSCHVSRRVSHWISQRRVRTFGEHDAISRSWVFANATVRPPSRHGIGRALGSEGEPDDTPARLHLLRHGISSGVADCRACSAGCIGGQARPETCDVPRLRRAHAAADRRLSRHAVFTHRPSHGGPTSPSRISGLGRRRLARRLAPRLPRRAGNTSSISTPEFRSRRATASRSASAPAKSCSSRTRTARDISRRRSTAS